MWREGRHASRCYGATRFRIQPGSSRRDRLEHIANVYHGVNGDHPPILQALIIISGCNEESRMPKTLLALFAASLNCAFGLGAQGVSPLRRVDMKLDAIADSESYLVYAYRIVNAPESRGGAAVFSLDVSAPQGTGFPTLPATGRFYHGAGFPHVVLAQFRDHVPVGPISPTNWEAFLTREATLDWYGSHGGFEGDIDSIAPGDSLPGFALRSPYLPGVRKSWAAPTFKSCCTELRPPGQSSEPENPNPSEFKILGWTVAPMYPPGKVTLGVVQALLGRVCGGLRWVSDPSVCQDLRAKLNEAAPSRQRGDLEVAKSAVRAFVDELEAQHGAGKPVSDNAYWLLKVNAEYVLSHL
jgi:hypothetical protein